MRSAISIAAATINLGPHTLFCLAGSQGLLHSTFDPIRHESAKRLWALVEGVAGEEGRAMLVTFAGQVREYGVGERTRFDVRIDPLCLARGTPFQQRVWGFLAGVPFGDVRTYGELAAELGNRNLSRAVGQACHHNPLALVIPCHRVVGKNGLCGFAGGLTVKGYLLALESDFRRSSS